ncbi:MAG: nuclear transport factor 2 family protein [Riemerella sp.]|nr:nuclear transport factor 2 family protein [Riemerella sp.]
MKNIFLSLFAVLAITSCIQTNAYVQNKSAKEVQEIQDRIALKNLVDTFSNLADEKKVTEQMELFTDDAEVSTIENGRERPPYVGKQAIGKAFANYLALFHTVYHSNGQQTVEINGNIAKGISYCQVVLIGNFDGKEMQRTAGVRYSDTYVKKDGKWLIKKRVSNFMYSEMKELKK